MQNTHAILFNAVAEKEDREQLLQNLEQKIKEKRDARKAQKQEFRARTEKSSPQSAYNVKPQQNHPSSGTNGHQARGRGRRI